jgi:hypothetical protein
LPDASGVQRQCRRGSISIATDETEEFGASARLPSLAVRKRRRPVAGARPLDLRWCYASSRTATNGEGGRCSFRVPAMNECAIVGRRPDPPESPATVGNPERVWLRESLHIAPVVLASGSPEIAVSSIRFWALPSTKVPEMSTAPTSGGRHGVRWAYTSRSPSSRRARLAHGPLDVSLLPTSAIEM